MRSLSREAAIAVLTALVLSGACPKPAHAQCDQSALCDYYENTGPNTFWAHPGYGPCNQTVFGGPIIPGSAYFNNDPSSTSVRIFPGTPLEIDVTPGTDKDWYAVNYNPHAPPGACGTPHVCEPSFSTYAGFFDVAYVGLVGDSSYRFGMTPNQMFGHDGLWTNPPTWLHNRVPGNHGPGTNYPIVSIYMTDWCDSLSNGSLEIGSYTYNFAWYNIANRCTVSDPPENNVDSSPAGSSIEVDVVEPYFYIENQVPPATGTVSANIELISHMTPVAWTASDSDAKAYRLGVYTTKKGVIGNNVVLDDFSFKVKSILYAETASLITGLVSVDLQADLRLAGELADLMYGGDEEQSVVVTTYNTAGGIGILTDRYFALNHAYFSTIQLDAGSLTTPGFTNFSMENEVNGFVDTILPPQNSTYAYVESAHQIMSSSGNYIAYVGDFRCQ